MTLEIETDVNVGLEPCVAAWNKNLYVGTECGSVIVLNENLQFETKWTAHEVQIFAIAISKTNVYTSSNDGCIKVWTLKGEKVTELRTDGAEIGAMFVLGEELYAGDEGGNIFVYENNALKAFYNVLEEVKDVVVQPPYMFTARDLYVTITEIKPDQSKDRFVTRHVMEGRAPMRILNESRLVVIGRGGNNLQLHELSLESKFKKLHEVKVSEMILTSLTTSGDFAWTAGWDGFVRRWNASGERLEAAGEINLGGCINALVTSSLDHVCAIITGGRVLIIKSM
ncbi:uncharacterized protein LOC123710873 [Pieris brassicae]|uniref:Uncharacterized protein n=1 Tax=Pieris brassicae TaxID=7116 RepID=A0A9P0XEK9_PIEBR|nr:uncharacterized protein LOC123710873 [Pieris brassicae]CAH4032040.1 unnamed protein product [Pieris brassicae]